MGRGGWRGGRGGAPFGAGSRPNDRAASASPVELLDSETEADASAAKGAFKIARPTAGTIAERTDLRVKSEDEDGAPREGKGASSSSSSSSSSSASAALPTIVDVEQLAASELARMAAEEDAALNDALREGGEGPGGGMDPSWPPEFRYSSDPPMALPMWRGRAADGDEDGGRALGGDDDDDDDVVYGGRRGPLSSSRDDGGAAQPSHASLARASTSTSRPRRFDPGAHTSGSVFARLASLSASEAAEAGRFLHVVLPSTLPIPQHVETHTAAAAAAAAAASAGATPGGEGATPSSSSPSAASSSASHVPPYRLVEEMMEEDASGDPSEPYRRRAAAVPAGKLGTVRGYRR